MSKKIFAIGGGKEIGLYREMFKLSESKNPELLLLPHAVPLNQQQSNYDRMYNILVRRFGCKMKMLKSNQLANLEKTKEALSSSDIIYISEGNTAEMLQLWKMYGFDKLIREQWENGKLMCGTSAGAVCWFNSFSTSNQEQVMDSLEGLDFIDAYITVHGQETMSLDFLKQAIANNYKLGILLTNGAAIEIIDDKCKFIINENEDFFPFSTNKISPYAIVSFFENGKYYERKIDSTTDMDVLGKSLVKKL